ncbi:MAG TPA: class I SAM-dependent methyltransferase [Burkholderiales bacterium]|nr:class I SAM-dependent methyltransferase [Burkholderiales bacterium]
MTRAKKPASAKPERFDRSYYEKWYSDDDEDRVDIAEQAARFVLSYVDHMDSSIGTVLDLGCGVGLWKAALAKQSKRVRYTGVEYSSYLCERYGWERGSAVDYSPGRTFDLVVCQGVLQYLDDAQCERAIANLAKLSRRFLYLEVLTSGDARRVCDPEGTDFEVHVRDARWYAARLKAHFVNLGGGLYAKPSMREHYFELWCTTA